MPRARTFTATWRARRGAGPRRGVLTLALDSTPLEDPPGANEPGARGVRHGRAQGNDGRTAVPTPPATKQACEAAGFEWRGGHGYVAGRVLFAGHGCLAPPEAEYAVDAAGSVTGAAPAGKGRAGLRRDGPRPLEAHLWPGRGGR